MTSSIRTNLASASALATLAAARRSQDDDMRSAATGLRISGAQDNAAIWAASTGLRSDITVLHEVVANIAAADLRLETSRKAAEQVASLTQEAMILARPLEGDPQGEEAAIRRNALSEVMGQIRSILDTALGAGRGPAMIGGSTDRVVLDQSGRTLALALPALTERTINLDGITARLNDLESATSNPLARAGVMGATVIGILDEDIPPGAPAVTPPVAASGNGVNGSFGNAIFANNAGLTTTATQMLVYGTQWSDGTPADGVSLTYSFHKNGVSQYIAGYSSGASSAAGELPTIAQNAVREILTAISQVINITFVEVADAANLAGDLRFGTTSAAIAATAFGFLPTTAAEGGDIWFGRNPSNFDFSNAAADWSVGSYAYMTIVHEIGHALGLKHPHDSNYWGSNAVGGSSQDSIKTSVMSYRDHVGDALDGAASTPQPTGLAEADILALQYLYGASSQTNGNNSYQWSQGDKVREALYDAGGNDLLDLSGFSSNLRVNLTPGTWSEIGPPVTFYGPDAGQPADPQTLFIMNGTIIESVTTGGGHDVITGNVANNQIDGGSGNDTIAAGAGDDTLQGGTGTDSIDGGAGTDTLILGGNLADFTVTALSGYPGGYEWMITNSTDVTQYIKDIESLMFLDQTLTPAAAATPSGTPTFSASASGSWTKAEGDSGATTYVFTVTRTGPTTGTDTVEWRAQGSTAPGTAASATDFIGGTFPGGTLTFGAGETSKLVTISVAGDTSSEPTEGFEVLLENPSTGSVLGGALQGVITDDDAPPTLAIAVSGASSRAEGANGANTEYVFTVTRSGNLSSASTVDWAVEGSAHPGGTADATDFLGGTLPAGSINFAAGEATKTLTVTVAGDLTAESDEGFLVRLSNASSASITGATAQATIVDDDTLPALAVQDVVAALSVAHKAAVSAAAAAGAAQRRLAIASTFAQTLQDQATRGLGVLIDADLGDVSARMQANAVRTELAAQALAIANNSPQSILALFR